ncbi:replication protein A 70 kDa DNA-binding subunit C-like isoform X4 [Triticum urartu]|uniref:replication protein A 70 kDa DNA-binding subunit C-like isoform X4 n=1 Tax=Triticum urartu TaxID=4572 RepID=UPI0020441395|nr:replication protein A 70 kDa DNA-binding subunit C-like isoform X4 [Triticum urartu]
MESSTALKSITSGQQNCRVFARLIRLWDAKIINPIYGDGLLSIDGILLDEDGNMAQMSVPKKYGKQFRGLLSEGSVYIISDIVAIDNRSKSYVYHHQNYMLQFKHDTKVHALHSRGANIPTVSFNFCPFDQLPRKAIDSKQLLDIIGVISDVGPYDYASPTSQNKLRKIKIRNLDEQTQEVVLWGKHGESFDEEAVLKKSLEGIVIAIFAGITATSQKFTGTIQGSSSSATQVYLDLNIPEVQHYRSSYQWKFPTLQKNLPKVAHLSPLEAAGKLYTIEQISTLPTTSFQGGATFSTIAKVTSIIPSIKWYYKACKRCGKGYNNMSDTPTCTCQFPVPCPMYKLPLTLTDSSASLNAVAFNKVAEDLVERHAEQVSMNMTIDAADQVLSLDKAIGKERLFYIGMNIDSTAKYPIKYVLKKSFPVDNTKSVPLLTASKLFQSAQDNLAPTSSVINAESPSAQQPEAPLNNTPASDNRTPIITKESESSSEVKRRIDFDKDDANNSNSSKSTDSPLSKRQKQSENNKNAANNYEKTD